MTQPHLVEAAARRMADAVLAGRLDEAVREVAPLSEAMSLGAHTVAGLVDRMERGMSHATWADVYADKQREIRAMVHGEIGAIQEACRFRRFRVLATENAPADPNRFRDDLVKSFRKLVAAYEAVAVRAAAIECAVPGQQTERAPDDAALTDFLVGFVRSLSESAGRVARDGARLIASGQPDVDLASIARAHDVLADGIEDFAISIAFARRVATFPGERP